MENIEIKFEIQKKQIDIEDKNICLEKSINNLYSDISNIKELYRDLKTAYANGLQDMIIEKEMDKLKVAVAPCM